MGHRSIWLIFISNSNTKWHNEMPTGNERILFFNFYYSFCCRCCCLTGLILILQKKNLVSFHSSFFRLKETQRETETSSNKCVHRTCFFFIFCFFFSPSSIQFCLVVPVAIFSNKKTFLCLETNWLDYGFHWKAHLYKHATEWNVM